eukprot:CAMPEP_0204372018 /NCGR_PEP_ID=MMETSP0469-20131031/46948_1 /ASSEMBLY_ACC=CAM_ASM_000384 /TAXON_ID=2969 /ORGANISM="Oxyrrhis marina" /LENGTH=181 /DNA_ID=CAMNT_0051362235 /DNA_START=11 /DNA_END=553 /DNA_ORIENTATION=+
MAEVVQFSQDHVFYKVVAVLSGRFLSVYDGATEFIVGHPTSCPVRPRHQGGLYVFPSYQLALDALNGLPRRRGRGLYLAPRKILRCRCVGPFLRYPGDKIAACTVVPVGVLDPPVGYQAISRPTSADGVRDISRGLARTQERVAVSREMRAETRRLEQEVAVMERVLQDRGLRRTAESQHW